MHVFVTGASGFIGRSVIADLQSHGHTVLALSRSDKSSSLLTSLGAQTIRGSTDDLDVLKQAASQTDGVIHLAFTFDLNDFAGSVVKDTRAINAMGEVMQGTGKPLVIASGTLIAIGSPATEDTEPKPDPPFGMRYESAKAVYGWSEKGVRGSVVRLAPTVHDVEDWGFIPMLIGKARENGFVGYIEPGDQRWPAIHRSDAATVFRLALEKGRAGTDWNGTAEDGVRWKDIATAMAEKIGLPVRGLNQAEAHEKLGFFAHAISIDNWTNSDKTQRELGWTPSGIGLIEDIERNYGESNGKA